MPPESTERFTGAITSAATFGMFSISRFLICSDSCPIVSGGKTYFVVGSEGGVYVCMRGELSA